MTGPVNLRAYGLLMRQGRLLISAEYVCDVFVWKFPGGGVESHETAEQALAREFMEETGLAVSIGRLLYAPGTLLSPWSHADYTPVFYEVAADGEVVVPPHEPVEMSFKPPRDAVASGLMAEPEMAAIRILLSPPSG